MDKLEVVCNNIFHDLLFHVKFYVSYLMSLFNAYLMIRENLDDGFCLILRHEDGS
jgi:hypothetical protein